MFRLTLHRSGLCSKIYEGAWLARALAASLLNSSPLQGAFCSSPSWYLPNVQVPEASGNSPGLSYSRKGEIQDGVVSADESLHTKSLRDSEMFSAQRSLGEVAAQEERVRALADSSHKEDLEVFSSQLTEKVEGGRSRWRMEESVRIFNTRLETVGRIVTSILEEKESEARVVVEQVLDRWLKDYSARRTPVDGMDTDAAADRAAMRKYLCYMEVCRTANSVARHLGKRDSPHLALEVFRWMQRQGWCKLDPHLSTTMLTIMGSFGHIEHVEELFEDMLKAEGLRLDSTSYNAAINAFFRCGRFADGIKIFEMMKDGLYRPPDIFTYNIVIRACGREGINLSRIGRLFREMQSRGIEPDIVTYTTLISICAKRRLVKEAEQFYLVAKKKGVQLNEVTYTALIWAYGNSGFRETAFKVYEEMKSMGCKPNTTTFSTLINSLMVGDEFSVESLGWVMEEMYALGVPTTTVIYNQLMSAYIREDRLQEAGEILMRMRRTGCKPNNMTFATIMKAYIRSGSCETVLKMYEDLHLEKVKLTVYLYTAVIDACGKIGDIEKIPQIFKDMKRARIMPSLVTYTTVLWALSTCKKREDAACLLKGFQIFDSAVTSSICKLFTTPTFDDDNQVKDLILSIFDEYQNKDTRSLTILCAALVDSLWNLGLRRRAALVLAVAMQHVRVLEGACFFDSREWTLDIHKFSSGCARVAFYQWLARLSTMARRLGPPERRFTRWANFQAEAPVVARESFGDRELFVEGGRDIPGVHRDTELDGERKQEDQIDDKRVGEVDGVGSELNGESLQEEQMDGERDEKVGSSDTEMNLMGNIDVECDYEQEAVRRYSEEAANDFEEAPMPIDGPSDFGRHRGREESTSSTDMEDRGDWEVDGSGGSGARREGWDWAVQDEEMSGEYMEEGMGEAEFLLPISPFTAPDVDAGYLDEVSRFPNKVVVVTGSGMFKQRNVANVRASVEAEVMELGAPFRRASLVPGWRRFVVRGSVLRAWLRQPGLTQRLQLRDIPVYGSLDNVSSGQEGYSAAERAAQQNV